MFDVTAIGEILIDFTPQGDSSTVNVIFERNSGGALYKLKDKKLSDLNAMSISEIENIVNFSNASGALTTTRRGAIPAVPTMNEIIDCINNVPKLNM